MKKCLIYFSVPNLFIKSDEQIRNKLDLELFYRQCNDLNAWVKQQEAFLADHSIGDSMDAIMTAIKQQTVFESEFHNNEIVQAFAETARKLIDGQHCVS